MDAENLRTLITSITSVLCIIISNIFVLLSSKTNEKKNKNNSILEQQYNQLFTPIHRILFFTKLEDCDKITRIYNVIYSNYNLSTDVLRNEFNNCLSNKKITVEFQDIIDGGCKCLEKSLGYKDTELSQQQQEISKTVIYLERNSQFDIAFLKKYFKFLSIVSIANIVLTLFAKLLIEYYLKRELSNISFGFIFSDTILTLEFIIFSISLVTYIVLTMVQPNLNKQKYK